MPQQPSTHNLHNSSAVDAVYLAADDYLDDLLAELGHRGATIVWQSGRLVAVRGLCEPAAWAQNTWLAPQRLPVPSIKKAAQALRSIQRNWSLHSTAQHRRARLIADQLPSIRFRALQFPANPPTAPLGGWTLMDRDHMLVAGDCSSPFPGGAVKFVEDRDNPPNRAYLKLWEALTLARQRPQPGQHCLDLGAAPGGWSWVLSSLGARVTCVDRAELAPAIAASPLVKYWRGDAFAVTQQSVGTPDWIVSDVIAYPERILELARYWATTCPQAAMIVTVKFQHNPNPAILDDFLAIPAAGIMHLSHNKHELTWFRLGHDGPPPEAAGRSR